jgi:carbon storage regulator
MLVLSRKVNENIVIDGRIIVKVVRTEGNFVKLGIEAPADVPVHRQEIYDEIQRSNQAALTSARPDAFKLRPAKLAVRPAPNQGYETETHGGSA